MDLPELPDGARMMVGLCPVGSDQPSQRSYQGENGRGPLEPWFFPFGVLVEVRGGRALLPVGDGAQQIAVWLYPSNGSRAQVSDVEPAQFVGGPGLLPITIRVPAAALRAALSAPGATGKW